MALSAHTVAAELRARERGLGRLKLHKLLYYCQAHHLAAFGEPLFEDTVSAWDNGPVVGRLWFAEKQNKGPLGPTGSAPGEAELNTVGYVLSRYGGLTGPDLMRLTHSEDPWRRADEDRRPRGSARIEPDWMRDYFRGEVDEDDETPLDSTEVEAWLKEADPGLDEVHELPDELDEIAAKLAELRQASSVGAQR